MSATIEKIWLFILTKTGVIRWVAIFVTSWLIARGYLKADAEDAVVGAIVALIVGALGKAIESVKDYEAKKTQRLINNITPDSVTIERDGLAGKETRGGILSAVSVASNPNKKG